MRKHFLLILLLIIAFQPLSGQKKVNLNAFEKYVEKLKTTDEDLKHAWWSVSVAHAATGKFLFEHNSNFSLMPASNMKTITTGIGLFLLGADYQFKTKFEYTGTISDSILYGDIYIVGGGDPSLGSSIYANTVPDSVFLQWTQAIRSLGVKQINGTIIGDTRFFDDENRFSSWELDDIGTDYGAGVSGIQFIDNICKLRIESASSVDKKPNLVSIEPYIPEIAWENHLTSVDNERASEFTVYSSPYSSQALIFGKVPVNSKNMTRTVAIPNTAYTCVWHFNKYLNQNGILTANRVDVLERRTPDLNKETRKYFYTYNSPVFTEIVNETNKSSNNSFAESILKVIGAELGEDGTVAAGRKLIAEKLKELNVPTDGFRQSDGSGLSRHGFVTTKFLCNYLTMLYNSDVYNDFVQSLPIAGVDGTMKNMLKNTAAEGNVRAKSGTISSGRSYSGYVTTKSGETLCFSFIFNHFTCRTPIITQKLEKLMTLLAEVE